MLLHEIKGFLETPPRAWGRRGGDGDKQDGWRNTPTGVGKTTCHNVVAACPRKHPHGRGEDERGYGTCWKKVETPPRAWGRPLILVVGTWAARNTPTGVGKTLCGYSATWGGGKHPHGRGEDSA